MLDWPFKLRSVDPHSGAVQPANTEQNRTSGSVVTIPAGTLMIDVSPPSVSTAWWRMRRTFLTTTSVCGGWETSTAFRPSLCSAGRETEPSWSETAASRAATPAPWCKSPVQYLWCNRVWTFCSGSNLICLRLSQGGWRGETLRHQQDQHRLRVRRALQPVRLPEGAGASLPAHLAGPTQRLAQRHAGLPRLQPAETVTRRFLLIHTVIVDQLQTSFTHSEQKRLVYTSHRTTVEEINTSEPDHVARWSLRRQESVSKTIISRGAADQQSRTLKMKLYVHRSSSSLPVGVQKIKHFTVKGITWSFESTSCEKNKQRNERRRRQWPADVHINISVSWFGAERTEALRGQWV